MPFIRQLSFLITLFLLAGCLPTKEDKPLVSVYVPHDYKIFTQKSLPPPSSTDAWNRTIQEKLNDPLAHFLASSSYQNLSPPPSSFQVPARTTIAPIHPAQNYLFEAKPSALPPQGRDPQGRNPQGRNPFPKDSDPDSIDPYGQRLYQQAHDTLALWLEKEFLLTAPTPSPTPSSTSSTTPSTTPLTTQKKEATLTVKNLLQTLPAVRAGGLLGLSQDTISTWLGSPHQKRREGYTEIWQFQEDECVLTIYFYQKEHIPPVLKKAILDTLDTLQDTQQMITAYAENYTLPYKNTPCS